jgi:hypothetical protein
MGAHNFVAELVLMGGSRPHDRRRETRRGKTLRGSGRLEEDD